MLTGLLLIDKREPIWQYYQKRLKRTGVPFLAWNIVYLLWRMYHFGDNVNIYSALNPVGTVAVHYHLWFLHILIRVYFIDPVVRMFISTSDLEKIRTVILIWIAVVSLIPFAASLNFGFHGSQIKFGIRAIILSGYVGYLILGYALGKCNVNRKLLISCIFV
jgi:surface polysaccharide O-acyltransferase-like enzyme